MYFEYENPTFTGNSWLDGIIWSKGVKKSKSRINIYVDNLPYPLIDEIVNSFDELEFETDLDELFFKTTREQQLFMIVVSPIPIFENLPSFKERRILKTHPKDFLEGFLIARLRIFKKRRGTLAYTLRVIDIGIRENIEDILDYLGVEYRLQNTKIEIDRNSYDIPPFDKYLEMLEKEKKELFISELDVDKITSDIVNEIMSKQITQDFSNLPTPNFEIVLKEIENFIERNSERNILKEYFSLMEIMSKSKVQDENEWMKVISWLGIECKKEDNKLFFRPTIVDVLKGYGLIECDSEKEVEKYKELKNWEKKTRKRKDNNLTIKKETFKWTKHFKTGIPPQTCIVCGKKAHWSNFCSAKCARFFLEKEKNV